MRTPDEHFSPRAERIRRGVGYAGIALAAVVSASALVIAAYAAAVGDPCGDGGSYEWIAEWAFWTGLVLAPLSAVVNIVALGGVRGRRRWALAALTATALAVAGGFLAVASMFCVG